MPIKECTGKETENNIDVSLNALEDEASKSKGKGLITEDSYDELVRIIDEARDANNKIKCMVSKIPTEATSPESIIEEIESKTGASPEAEE